MEKKIVVKSRYTGRYEIYLTGERGSETAEVREGGVVVRSYPYESMTLDGHHGHIDKARCFVLFGR